MIWDEKMALKEGGGELQEKEKGGQEMEWK
jgi:hypothetical protein